jgi:hypothetical protein
MRIGMDKEMVQISADRFEYLIRQSERYNVERKTMKDTAKRDARYEVECDIKRLEEENERLSAELKYARIEAEHNRKMYLVLKDACEGQHTKTSWWKRLFR